ncbi:MAG: riboflavin synthase [Proteobacteria bacterium]|nr:riboflavin synthase [Pseudomonadota bacterium]
MFTGIVEGKGKVKSLGNGSSGFTVTIEAPFDLSSDKVGDSISVNGICLTATKIEKTTFSADVSKETLSRTNLGKLKSGSEVNLERALKLGDRLGGHLVTGHIDGPGTVKKIEKRGESLYIEIALEEKELKYIVKKGSVTVDGISLTVNSVGNDFFTLNIIPHTLELTTLGEIKPGSQVNIETDIIGKYVEKLIPGENAEKVTMDLLQKSGFA